MDPEIPYKNFLNTAMYYFNIACPLSMVSSRPRKVKIDWDKDVMRHEAEVSKLTILQKSKICLSTSYVMTPPLLLKLLKIIMLMYPKNSK